MTRALDALRLACATGRDAQTVTVRRGHLRWVLAEYERAVGITVPAHIRAERGCMGCAHTGDACDGCDDPEWPHWEPRSAAADATPAPTLAEAEADAREAPPGRGRGVETMAPVTLDTTARWQIIEGDSLDVLLDLPEASVDAVVTDPPYATTGESSAWVSKDKVRSLPRETQFFEAWIREMLTEFARVLRPTGGMWISCDWAAALAIDKAASRAGLRAPIIGVWHREGLGMGFALRHVYECFAVITMPKWERRLTDEPDLWTHKWTPSDRRTGHSAEKPIELMARAIRLLVPPGSTVLDPFCGSASTGMAAIREGCGFIGIERDDAFAAMGRERLAAEEAGSTLEASRAGQLPLLGGAA